MSSKKKISGIVYSTDPNFHYNYEEEAQQESLPPDKQLLKVIIDKKHRGGKVATLIKGFIGSDKDIDNLGKVLKIKCGTGGSVKNGEIIIQGENAEKITTILTSLNYKVKK